VTIDLHAIEERVEKAWPGPWRFATEETWPRRILAPDGTHLGTWSPSYEDDADFIAHAREDIPLLLSELKRLEAEKERVVALSKRWREYVEGMDKLLRSGENFVVTIGIRELATELEQALTTEEGR
jgi:hypothetical protein